MKRRLAGEARLGLSSLIVALAVVVAACTTAPEPSFVPPDVFFPRMPAENGPRPVLLASYTGALEIQDGCLWITRGESRHLLIWRQSHQLGWSGRHGVILQDGLPVAEIGELITIGGGELNARDLPGGGNMLQQQLGVEIPPACRSGPFWVVSGVGT